MKPESSARLTVEGLRVCLQGSSAEVVSALSLEVAAGEILGLVGESGSGKTTVGLAVMGHARRGLELRNGVVMFDGEDLLKASPRRLRQIRGARVSYVPQDPSAALNPALRVGTQIKEVLTAHETSRARKLDFDARISEVLSEVRLDGINGIVDAYPHQLSGGQRQRVALAMAFACRPGLIVLDEPTTGLDVSTQRHVLDTVRYLCEVHGTSAIYISHDLAVVGQLAHRVAVMYSGRIVEIQGTECLFGEPGHPYTRALLRAVPSPERRERLQGIEGTPPRPSRRPTGCTFADRCEFVVDRCRTVEPELVPQPSGGYVRCIRTNDECLRARFTGAPATLDLDVVRGEALLSADGITARYAEKEVLHNVRLSLQARECVAVVGESGSGKTTLARCIVGLHTNWDGKLMFSGDTLMSSVRDRPRELTRRIQYIFQDPYTSLNPRKTIAQIVARPLMELESVGTREIQQRVQRALEEVSLSRSYEMKYPDQLSGGERQRVAIARALVVEPELLVCDEITSALDVSVQAVIVELLRRLQQERGLTMLFITHNVALVRSIAQSVIVLSNGIVDEAGPTDEVLDSPRAAYTARLLADVPRLSRTISVAGTPESASGSPSGAKYQA